MDYDYNARVYCVCASGSEHALYTFEGFNSYDDAIKWVSKKFFQLMTHWADIDENGIVIFGEVYDENEEHFSELHELRCGL